jgi:hypothetical protein
MDLFIQPLAAYGQQIQCDGDGDIAAALIATLVEQIHGGEKA